MVNPKNPPTKRSVGANIQKAREAAGLTQLALAHKMGRTGDDAGANISRIESGSTDPQLSTLRRIAIALGVTLESLL